MTKTCTCFHCHGSLIFISITGWTSRLQCGPHLPFLFPGQSVAPFLFPGDYITPSFLFKPQLPFLFPGESVTPFFLFPPHLPYLFHGVIVLPVHICCVQQSFILPGECSPLVCSLCRALLLPSLNLLVFIWLPMDELNVFKYLISNCSFVFFL